MPSPAPATPIVARPKNRRRLYLISSEIFWFLDLLLHAPHHLKIAEPAADWPNCSRFRLFFSTTCQAWPNYSEFTSRQKGRATLLRDKNNNHLQLTVFRWYCRLLRRDSWCGEQDRWSTATHQCGVAKLCYVRRVPFCDCLASPHQDPLIITETTIWSRTLRL